MLRLLVVLAVLGLAYMYFAGGADKDGKALRPEEQYKQQEQRVDAMQQQLHQQAKQQLENIDAISTPAPADD